MTKEFYIKQVIPSQFTRSHWLQLGKLTCDGFESDDLFNYATQPEYRFSNVVFESIQDPRDRLAQITKYERKVREFTRKIQGLVMDRGTNTFVIYDCATDAMAGMALWTYPADMIPQLEQEVGRTGFGYVVQRVLARAWAVVEAWVDNRFGTRPPVTFGSEFAEFQVGMHGKYRAQSVDESKLAKMTRQELESSVYPEHLMVYLSFFCISPQYQGMGVGSKLMKHCLESIPYREPVFSDGTLRSQGPQKLFLEASKPGSYLYEKYGFEKITAFEATFGQHYIPSWYMVKTI